MCCATISGISTNNQWSASPPSSSLQGMRTREWERKTRRRGDEETEISHPLVSPSPLLLVQSSSHRPEVKPATPFTDGLTPIQNLSLSLFLRRGFIRERLAKRQRQEHHYSKGRQ